MTDGPPSEPSVHQVLVATDSIRAHWTLTVARQGRGWLLALRGDGTLDTWAASGPDLFEALRNLRRLIDPLGFRLALNGARRDAWASGMQRDMGEGRYVYLLEPGETGRPEQVDTLGAAPIELTGSVAEQEAHYADWLNSRGYGTFGSQTLRQGNAFGLGVENAQCGSICQGGTASTPGDVA